MDNKRNEKIRFYLEVIGGVAALLALCLSIQANVASNRANEIAQAANQIAEKSIRPQIIPIGVDVSSTFSRNRDNYRLLTCRHQIKLFNGGGASTSLIEVATLAHFQQKVVEISNTGGTMFYTNKDNNTDVLVNVWTTTPPAFEDYLNTSSIDEVALINGTRLPAQIAEHGTTELYVDVTLRTEVTRFQGVPTEFVLKFPDAEPVTTQVIECEG